ncbi:Uncharacterised protein [Mycobacterium tuberculosis]|nr:Uncharacterised protein [Mycobacterium tuberculosis]
MWWSTIAWSLRLNSADRSFSASAKPTALVMPWPSGPVVVSTPGVTSTSGWPAVLLCSWRKFLSSPMGRS